jgi:hypothetical protein
MLWWVMTLAWVAPNFFLLTRTWGPVYSLRDGHVGAVLPETDLRPKFGNVLAACSDHVAVGSKPRNVL